MNIGMAKAYGLLRNLKPIKYRLDGQYDKAYTDKILQQNSDLIYDNIISEKPLMISRFGSNELNSLVNYRAVKSDFRKYSNYAIGKSRYYKWKKASLDAMCYNAGFFPYSFNMLEKFCDLVLEDAKLIDILGSWLKEEELFKNELSRATTMGIMNLEPYNHINPWSSALSGKKILVIHPFDVSINKQYKNRKYLFQDDRVLPDFQLKTLRAVQSVGMNETIYADWFEALDSMKSEVDKVDFDLAIIGCGAYGMSLAAHVKRIGKQAIHLGGATQILFGITGKRWEQEYDYRDKFFNEHWIRPMEEETPKNHQMVEESCYW